ncbi:hypothetical protein AVEN_32708-1 [Araneus ventricosus]|uniref:Uncharacterized protein n=1 Tax=Araneus ventricosus TaxID=182803 RepID=A0A4Y2W7I7_ARAVE|nr:hypothetical protein AVEN_32708-1 [Araneus ventricosus]
MSDREKCKDHQKISSYCVGANLPTYSWTSIRKNVSEAQNNWIPMSLVSEKGLYLHLQPSSSAFYVSVITFKYFRLFGDVCDPLHQRFPPVVRVPHRVREGIVGARPSPRVRSPTENHEPAQDFQRGSSSSAPCMRADDYRRTIHGTGEE